MKNTKQVNDLRLQENTVDYEGKCTNANIFVEEILQKSHHNEWKLRRKNEYKAHKKW